MGHELLAGSKWVPQPGLSRVMNVMSHDARMLTWFVMQQHLFMPWSSFARMLAPFVMHMHMHSSIL